MGSTPRSFNPHQQGWSWPTAIYTLTNRDSGETVRLKAGGRVLSYATRGMEPLRGFPEFLRALPHAAGDFCGSGRGDRRR